MQGKEDMDAWVSRNNDKRFIMYLGEGGQMMQTDDEEAIYLGGVNVGYNLKVVKFT